MKRFISLFLILILLFTCFPALAAEEIEATASSVAYIEDAAAEPYSTRKTVFVTNSVVTVYTCPVRKNDVTVVFHSSERPTSVKIRLRLYDSTADNWETETAWFIVPLGGSHTFELEEPTRYEVQVGKVTGTDPNGYCTFYITTVP